MAITSKSRARNPVPATASPSSNLSGAIRARARSPQFKRYIQDLLVELCKIDTTPNPRVAHMRSAEDACFKILERELGSLDLPGSRLERRPVNPAIQKHENYSLLHFTKTLKRPGGLTPEETYQGRSNLVCVIPGSGEAKSGIALALNAHVDVVAPYFPPSIRNGTIFGRGACDDKGPVVGIVAALKLLAEILGPDRALNRNVVSMFVVEEETGGNGSLSLAIDRDLRKLYDSILVGECTALKLYPANRGAVWYRAAIRAPRSISAFEMFAFINEEMENEGKAIRAESFHPLFPQRPVQTCHGIIGPFGEHPSRICGEVSFEIRFRQKPNEPATRLLRDCLESGLSTYVGLYGDKTTVKDPATGKPMVERHYDINAKGKIIRVHVHGATGHMGAIRDRDGAITKMAHLVRALLLSRTRLEKVSGGALQIELAGKPYGEELVLEGGQGFVPTHRITEVMERLRNAAERGADRYLRWMGHPGHGKDLLTVTYEKLHNVAFDGDPNSRSMKNALAAAAECGLPSQEPVLGWTVSCDARLFAMEYPGMDVLTFGPGVLSFAHSDQEQIEIADIVKAAEFLACFILRQTATDGL